MLSSWSLARLSVRRELAQPPGVGKPARDDRPALAGGVIDDARRGALTTRLACW